MWSSAGPVALGRAAWQGSAAASGPSNVCGWQERSVFLPNLVILQPPSLCSWWAGGPQVRVPAARPGSSRGSWPSWLDITCPALLASSREEPRTLSCPAAASPARPCIRQRALFWDLKLISSCLFAFLLAECHFLQKMLFCNYCELHMKSKRPRIDWSPGKAPEPFRVD